MQAFRHATLLKRDSNTVVSCEFCKIFKNGFFTEHLRWLLLKFTKMTASLSNHILFSLICSSLWSPCCFSMQFLYACLFLSFIEETQRTSITINKVKPVNIILSRCRDESQFSSTVITNIGVQTVANVKIIKSAETELHIPSNKNKWNLIKS